MAAVVEMGAGVGAVGIEVRMVPGFLDTMREFARGDVHRLIDEVRRRLEAARDAVAARQSEAGRGPRA